jgi:hypothetical protein
MMSYSYTILSNIERSVTLVERSVYCITYRF